MHSRMYMLFLKNIRLRLTDSTKYVKLFSENLCGKQMKQKAETFLRILGIDPGLATMGWGVIEADGYREKLVQYGALITYPRDTFPTRLRCIYTGVQGLLQTFKPDEIAFEELFFSKNVTTGIQVGGARGVALVACQAYTDKLFEYTPMQIKQAVVGYGGADKHQVQMMVRMLLGLKEIPRPDDAADAIAIALCHARSSTSLLHQKGYLG